MPWTAIASAAGQLGNSILGHTTSKANNRRTIKAQKELAEYSYRKDREMWNEMNKYNDPSAQMARLKAAGLNPHLVYGSGAKTEAAPAPQYNTPDVEYQHEPLQLPQFNHVRLQQAQVDNVEAQTKSIEARTVLDVLRQSGILSDNQKKEVEAKLADRLMEANVWIGENKMTEQHYRIENQKLRYVEQHLKNEILEYRKKWEKYGITGKDALIIRTAVRLFEGMKIPQPKWLRDIIKEFNFSFD